MKGEFGLHKTEVASGFLSQSNYPTRATRIPARAVTSNCIEKFLWEQFKPAFHMLEELPISPSLFGKFLDKNQRLNEE